MEVAAEDAMMEVAPAETREMVPSSLMVATEVSEEEYVTLTPLVFVRVGKELESLPMVASHEEALQLSSGSVRELLPPLMASSVLMISSAEHPPAAIRTSAANMICIFRISISKIEFWVKIDKFRSVPVLSGEKLIIRQFHRTNPAGVMLFFLYL